MPLNTEQQKAVDYLEGPLLVLAGPGTGKTQLLSAKVAHILEVTDVNASNILCLTFTEAGAENMRDRLKTMIGKDALDVNIHTYHAFGASLLERYRNYAETTERALDAPVDETAQYKIIADIQRHLSATDILKDAAVPDLIETISNAKAARLSATDLRRIAEQNLADSQAISAEISPILLAYVPRSKFPVALAGTYQPILEILTNYISPEPIVGNIERTANLMARELDQIIKDLSLEEKPKLKPLSAWKDKWFEATELNGEKTYRLSDLIANKKLLSLANIMEQYATKLEENGLYDFNDMIEQAISFMKNDTGFRLSLEEQFQYILLDEFQDTNASQFELIKLITDYEKPVVMAVGDDDQAIFEFQGANASNLMDFQKHYNAEIVTLTKNYRSAGDILSFSRHIAEQIENSFAKKYHVDKTLEAMRPAEACAKVSRHEFPGSEAEYYWLAEQIEGLIKAGADPNEIAIIAPKHKNIAPILPYLKERSIDVTYEKRDNVLADEKIQQIIKLARFVQELAKGKQPSHQLLEILSFDFWNLPAEVVLSAVSEISHSSRNTLDYLQGDPELEKIATLLAELAKHSFTTPLELWLDYLIGRQPITEGVKSPMLDYYESHLSTAELLEFYENLATLRQSVLAHVQNMSASKRDFVPRLTDFLTTVDDYETAETAINRISIYRDSSNSVQVMTAHKSKGLEFKYVFLTSVDDSAWGKSAGNNNRLALPKNLLQIRHTGITDDEKLRLFFVAITRAKQFLSLSNAVNSASGSTLARLRYLSESSRDESEQISPFLPRGSQEIQLHLDELDDLGKIATLRLNWISAYQKLQPDVMTLLRERMKSYRLSATDLTDFIDVIYGGPQKVYQRKILRAPSEPTTFSLYYGTLLHSAFEKITNQGYTDEQAYEFFSNEAPKAPLDDLERLALAEKGLNSLKIALTNFGELVRRSGAKAEVNLSSEKLHLGEIPLTGKIDHIEIDNQAKTIEIFDYKTGSFHKEKWDRHPTLYKYRLQLGFYKLLLNLSPTYQKYQVKTGHILFVTPDAENKVYDKIYEFNDADEAELKQLIEAVYRQLTTLDFVTNPELFLPADKGNTLKEIRAFVAKLLEPPTPA